MRGCGKSHYSREIAQYLGWSVIDLDKEIEKKANKKILEIIEKDGWEYFRKMETEECKNLLSNDRMVVATGGGYFLPQKMFPF